MDQPRWVPYNPRALDLGVPVRRNASFMTPTDYVLIGIVAISAIVGVVRGLLREGISLLTWILAIWAAWHFGPALEPKLPGVLSDPSVRPWAARTILFIGVLLAGAAVAWIVGYFVQLSIFRGTDKLLGLLFGLLRGVVVLGVLVIIGQTLRVDDEPWWKTSKLMPYAESSANMLRGLVGEEPIRRAKELLSSVR